MKIFFLSRLFAFFLLIICFLPARSQSCGSCSVSISGLDSTNYTVNSGETFCIDSMGVFEGTLTLNGGTICNKGIFNPKLLSASSGTITNNSIVILRTNSTFGSGIVVNSSTTSITTIKGDLTVSGGAVNNLGIMNVKGDFIFNSGTFSNSAIVNCKILSGSSLASLTNSGIINKD